MDKLTPEEQRALDALLRILRHEKAFRARRAERYTYLRVHKIEREREIEGALHEYKKMGDVEKLRAVLRKWSFDSSTF